MAESSGVLSMVGVELMGWTKVSKGSRSSSRRSHKLASTSQESTMEQFDKTDDLSTSESEKIGASVLERRFSAKAEEIPFKKRNILFSPIPLSSSPSSPSPSLHIKDHEKPLTELHIVNQVSSVEKTDANDEFIYDMFKTKQNRSEEDFSGIKMLAAVACNDRAHIDTAFDEVTDLCKFSLTPTVNSGKNMTHKTDGIVDYKKSTKDNEMILDNIIFSRKQIEIDFISQRYLTNDAEFPTICSSSTTSGNFTTIDNESNLCGTSSKQYLSLSERVHKSPHTLEEIKEEDHSRIGVEHEKNVTSHDVGMERSPQDSLLSDEREDSGVTSGSNSDDDCPKFIVDAADTLKLNDSRFKGVSESSGPGLKCVAAKDDSSRVGINLGGGDSELEDGEFRDSFVHHWEGSEAEYGELEQVDYDSDDKDAFDERKEITPVGSMEDETLDTKSHERLLAKYSRTQHNTNFFIKDEMNRLFDYRKSCTKLGADFDEKNRNNRDDMGRNCYSTCLRTRHPHYELKRYKGSDFASYSPKDVVHGCSDRRANNSRGPMFKRCVKAGSWSREHDNIPMYRDKFVRLERRFLHEPNRGRPWDDHRSRQARSAPRQHSPYYNHQSESRRSPSERDFDTSHSIPRFPEYTRFPENHDYYFPDVGNNMTTDMRRERGRQSFRRSVSPDKAFHWTPQSGSPVHYPIPRGRKYPQVGPTTPECLRFTKPGEKVRRVLGERGPLVRWDGRRGAHHMRYGSRKTDSAGERRRYGGRGGWECPYVGKRKGCETQEFVEDVTGRRWRLRRGL